MSVEGAAADICLVDNFLYGNIVIVFLFQQFAEYPVTTALQDAENDLIPEIVDMLVEDVFNAAVANW